MRLGYIKLKLSWELYNKAPDALAATERQRLGEVARRQEHIEQSILRSALAAQVIVPATTRDTRLAEIRSRYADDQAYHQDLAGIGLDGGQLAAAVERDLKVEAILEKVAADVPAVSTVDAEIYYRLHPAAFDRPEARRLRHILVTFEHPAAKTIARDLLEKLRSTVKSSEQFAAAALRHSQCPTAMEGGILGVVKRQQLYPALEPAAFALQENEISGVLESPIGLHLVRCDEILPSGLLPFAEACPRIIERLTDKRRQEAQRTWLRQLHNTAR
ncbi:MAG: nitrogen fixation protein NifM [Dechloromonas sp.]|nr:nitrogen fixation protein NifM [Dechloromonas sp.]